MRWKVFNHLHVGSHPVPGALLYASTKGALAKKMPFGRLGRVTDIAPLAVFLASDESAWITGEVIRAAGGLVVAT
jgi:3-oxoacyl-[acyl-carrier protein] reductase